MADELDGERELTAWGVIGFVVLAILLGPVMSYTASSFAFAVEWQVLAGGAAASAFAGCVLAFAGALRGERPLDARQWMAAGVLMVPRVLEGMLGVGTARLGLHPTGWGVALLIAVAAPLWLGLLAAVEAVKIEVPRAVVAAGIAGIGAVLLVMPTDMYAISANQIPVLVVQLFVGMVTVFAWWFVRQRLVGAPVLPAAGLFLLMSAVMSGAASMMVERAAWQPVDWREAIVPVLMQAGLGAVTCWLWFYLLMRMRLTGFSMHPLAAWTAALVCELAMARFAVWKVDLAATIAVGAIAMGIRARIADEQMTVLGLREM
jgi:hypothetical protein